jgi:glutamine---fructose-6-phosphate transaminase (isomerizing)
VSLFHEIHEQPEVVGRLLARRAGAIASLKKEVSRRRPAFAVIAARGSSDHAAIYAQYLLGIRNHLPVALATPSAVTLYGSRPTLANGLVLGVSQSGQSEDIVAVVAEARRQQALTVAVTNVPTSPLAGAADLVLELDAGPERAVAATKTYTAQLIAMALVSLALDAATTAEDGALDRLPDLLAAALAADDPAARLAGMRSDMTRCVVLGRGYDYATAREWALKLQELAQVLAVPYSAADFEHGPLALVEPGFDVLAVAPSGPSLPALEALLSRLHGQLGARLLTISDLPRLAAIDAGLAAPSMTLPWLGPLINIVGGQLFAYHLTRAKGLDPDNPRTISKVTITR